MSLHLFLLRHGQAMNRIMEDYDRPLTQTGQKQIKKRKSFLQNFHHQPDHILCSPAIRTKESLEGLNLNLDNSYIDFDDELYLADSDTLLNKIHLIDKPARSVLLIAHNPGIHSLAVKLLYSPSSIKTEHEKSLISHFPAGALAGFRFPCKIWSDIRYRQAELVFFIP